MEEVKVSKSYVFSQSLTSSALLWDITQRIAVILRRNFETTYRYHLKDQETQEI